MIPTTYSLKWVNELQHDILSQLIIHSTLGFTLPQAMYYKSGTRHFEIFEWISMDVD